MFIRRHFRPVYNKKPGPKLVIDDRVLVCFILTRSLLTFVLSRTERKERTTGQQEDKERTMCVLFVMRDTRTLKDVTLGLPMEIHLLQKENQQ